MIEELVPQLDELKQSITTATIDGDPEETSRRMELTMYVHRLVIANHILKDLYSTFKQIEEASQEMLAKSALARFADKGKDSKVVAGLVQRLREAIVRYQVSDYCYSVGI
jgi:chromosome segregation ATPase